jgi:lipoate-protein ligase A
MLSRVGSGRIGIAAERAMSTDVWRLLDLEFEDPCANLAAEEVVMTAVGRGARNTLRFWRNTNTVVLGRFQTLEDEVDVEACRRHDTAVVRRFTGGGAVYHDRGNLNFAVSLHRSDRRVCAKALDTFGLFKTWIVDGLNRLNVAKAASTRRGVEVGGSKISGFAGAVQRGCVFCHGTLLVHSDLTTLRAVLRRGVTTPSGSPRIRSVRSEVVTLQAVLRRAITVPEVKTVLTASFTELFAVELVPSTLSLVEQNEVQERSRWYLREMALL